MKNCFSIIKNTIKNRSKHCFNLNDNNLKIAFEIANQKNPNTSLYEKSVKICSNAIKKYKKRVLCCGAKESYRKQKQNKYLNKLYKINIILKNNGKQIL